MLYTVAIRNSPATTCCNSLIRSPKLSKVCRISLLASNSARPSCVTEKFFFPRSIRLTSNRLSNARIC